MPLSPLESLKRTSPKLATRPGLAFLVETPAKSVAGPSPSSCSCLLTKPVLPRVAPWHAPFS